MEYSAFIDKKTNLIKTGTERPMPQVRIADITNIRIISDYIVKLSFKHLTVKK